MPALGVRPPEKLDETAAREVAVKQGLGVVLASSIAPSGAGYDISVRATQTVTGNEITSESARAANKDQVLETAARLVARVRSVLGDTESESRQLFAMRSVTTSSLEVLSHYAAAVEAQARGQFRRGPAEVAKAVELDPEFALGYQGLAAMSRNLGKTDEAEKYIKEALRFIDKLTERERFATRAYLLPDDRRQPAMRQGIRRAPGALSGRPRRPQPARRVLLGNAEDARIARRRCGRRPRCCRIMSGTVSTSR